MEKAISEERVLVLRFMRNHASEFVDECREVNCTGLAEATAQRMNHDELLDDELHFVWELSVKVAREVEALRQ